MLAWHLRRKSKPFLYYSRLQGSLSLSFCRQPFPSSLAAFFHIGSLVFPLGRCLSLAEAPSLTPPPLAYYTSTASSGDPSRYLCNWASIGSTSIVRRCNQSIRYILHLISSPQPSGLRNPPVVSPSWRSLPSTVRLQHTPNPLYRHCPPICSQIRI